MKIAIKPAILGLAIAFSLTSCKSNKVYNALLEERDNLAQSLADSQERIVSLEELNSQLVADNDAMNAEMDDMKADLKATMSKVEEIQGMVAAKQAELDQLKGDLTNAFGPYEDVGVEARDGKIYVSMPETILFNSGSSYLNRADRDIVSKFAEVLKADEGLSVLVEGHTDNANFIQGANSDNWDLSVRRSLNVVRALLKEGVAPSQITAAGSGEFSPVVTDNPDSAEARAANRRTEFIVIPNLDKLFDTYKMKK